jgi:uncharacterized protein YggE
MKKIISLSLVCISLLSAQTDIIFSKTFEKKIKPDTLTTNITFSTQKTSQETATNRLTKISDFVSAQNSVKSKGGDYSVNPHYDYDNGKNIQNGYDGIISYQLSSKNPEVLNKFTRELQRYGEKNGMIVAVSSASWGMSDNQEGSDGGVEDLRLEAIVWSDRYAKSLSSKIGKNCSIQKINFSGGGYYPQPMMMKASMAMSDSAPIPTQDEQNININANIEMVCK